ncbi:MAG TPA: hypothetical protein VKV17_04275 [Bryobacteraceae bacterium]|nr:hypothetical protein [Bryobacteraceae bacterium]
MRHLLWLSCAVSSIACAQQDPLMWIPLQVGTRWTYEHEWKSGDRNRPDVDRWRTEETVTGKVKVPEGLVVLRRVEIKEAPRVTHPGYLVARDGQPYLVHANCVYVIGEGWDRQNQSLRPRYQQYLAHNELSADFCFPLQMGQHWGNNDVPWSVEPARAGMASFVPQNYAGAIHIFSSHFGSGGWDDVWFQKGIGVVGEHYIHNGTYDEYTKKLVSFTP